MSRIDAVGLARQATGMGTKETTMEYFVPVESSGVTQNRATLEINETVGNRFPSGLDYGTRYFDVPMAGAPRMASLPRVLSGFFGQPDSAAAGSQFAHAFDPTVNGKAPEPHSIFVIRRDPSPPIVDLFWDAKGNTVALDVAPNDFLRMDASWIALDLDDTQSAPAIASDLSQRRKFSECIVEISTDAGTSWAAVATAGWGITYNNNLDTDEAVLGSRKLYALPFGNADCEVRWSPREQLTAQYRRALQTDPSQIALRMTATGPGGAAANKIVATVHSCEIVEAPAAVSGADVLKTIAITARARLADNGKFVTVAVTNGVTSYA